MWNGMLQRCGNPKNKAYANYGGRGIKVCESWYVFENFLADMGTCQAGMSLDRIDTNGDYSPKNCRWATRVVQNRNKRTNVLAPYQGEMIPLSELAERAGLPYGMVQSRYINGWPIDTLANPRRKNQWA